MAIKLALRPLELVDRARAKFFRRVDKTGDCWLWIGHKTHFGYGQMWIGQGHHIMAHRAAYYYEYGDIPLGLLVLHRCDNPSCVRPDHLWLGTAAENNQDRDSKGRARRNNARYRRRYAVGEDHPSAKLTIDQVLAIRDDRRSSTLIAKEFLVHRSTIDRIRRGDLWKNV